MSFQDCSESDGVLVNSSVNLVRHEQENYHDAMLALSHFGNPALIILYAGPIVYCLHQSIGIQFIWGAVLAEWLNAILKWMLHGERPYWWIHEQGDNSASEMGDYSTTDMLTLTQYELTCEVGPGSPSGHAMVTSVSLCVLISGILHYYCENKKFRIYVAIVMWSMFVMIMAAICISRCYIATHFPHQVMLGTTVGIVIAKTLNRFSMSSLPLQTYTVCAAVMMCGAILMYFILTTLGVDPDWSIVKAQRWCSNPAWVHLSTSLFYIVVRDCATLAGVGCGLYVYHRWTDDGVTTMRRASHKIICALISVLLIFCTEQLAIPQHPAILLYFLGFMKYFSLFSLIICVIPLLVNFGLLSQPEKQKVR